MKNPARWGRRWPMSALFLLSLTASAQITIFSDGFESVQKVIYDSLSDWQGNALAPIGDDGLIEVVGQVFVAPEKQRSLEQFSLILASDERDASGQSLSGSMSPSVVPRFLLSRLTVNTRYAITAAIPETRRLQSAAREAGPTYHSVHLPYSTNSIVSIASLMECCPLSEDNDGWPKRDLGRRCQV